MITLTIPGHAKPSVRITARSKWTPQAKAYLAWQNTVATCCMTIRPRPVPWNGIRMTFDFYVYGKRHGDLTNLTKSTEDGLQYGGLIANDKAVREIHARLFSCPPADERVEVTLDEFKED